MASLLSAVGPRAMDHAAEVARDRELIRRSRARIARTDDLVADSVGCLAESQRLLRALWALDTRVLAEPPRGYDLDGGTSSIDQFAFGQEAAVTAAETARRQPV